MFCSVLYSKSGNCAPKTHVFSVFAWRHNIFLYPEGKCSLTGGVPDSILQVTRRLHVEDDGWLRYQSVEKQVKTAMLFACVVADYTGRARNCVPHCWLRRKIKTNCRIVQFCVLYRCPLGIKRRLAGIANDVASVCRSFSQLTGQRRSLCRCFGHSWETTHVEAFAVFVKDAGSIPATSTKEM